MGELRFLVGVLGIYVLCIFIAQSSWVQFLALTLYFLWITLHLRKGKIPIMQKLFPNMSVVLDQTHVFKTCVTVELTVRDSSC